ncbi:MAG: hypothetical protein F6J93_24860 [Oscillatoria sp. SIO1A7]|nr:hypothetical protein [Oscillatoria sp. SIO1A7]
MCLGASRSFARNNIDDKFPLLNPGAYGFSSSFPIIARGMVFEAFNFIAVFYWPKRAIALWGDCCRIFGQELASIL